MPPARALIRRLFSGFATLLASPLLLAAGALSHADAPIPTTAASAPAAISVQQPSQLAREAALLAASCVNCHGPGGRSTGAIPSLRGLPADYLLQRMQAFKAGEAVDATVMARLMKGYDDGQIRALAQWFAADNEEGRDGQ